MKQTIPYCRASEAILGYSDSELAKSEKYDCAVRAIASAFDIPYDDAHKFTKVTFGREERRGTSNFDSKMRDLSAIKHRIGGKQFLHFGSKGTMKMRINDKKQRQMTVGSFIKKYPTGTYLISLTTHCFTIKDGVVIGNPSDTIKTKKIIYHAWIIL